MGCFTLSNRQHFSDGFRLTAFRSNGFPDASDSLIPDDPGGK